ncbi:MAG: sulfite exporter TauE/SafE family protein [Pseudomonadota bacterium]
MPELTPLFFAMAIPAVVFAGISKGGFGSGASFAAAPFLALILEPAVALGLMLPLLMLIDVAALRVYWRRWSRRDATRLIIGALPGTVLGTILIARADGDVLRVLIGVVALGFVAYQISARSGLFRPRARPWGPSVGIGTGVFAGFTSFVSHAGGPPVAVYLLSQGLSKTTYQATTVIVFTVVNVMKVLPYSFLGIFSAQTLWADLLLAPFALVGTWLGVRAHHMVSERVFFAITYVLLTLTGTKLIYDALV